VSLEDLQGKVVAYDDPSSTSGFMMPTSYLIANGLTPVEVNSPESAVGDDEVGYVFAGDDEVTLEWVVSGRVAAGVVDNLTYAEDLPEETRAQLTIIAETEDVARRVLMVRAGLDPELVAAIQDLFINLENVPEGAGILDTLSTVRFDEFPEGADAVLQTMRDMYTLVENQ
jgi:phosphonate transport system substrate-binding protein